MQNLNDDINLLVEYNQWVTTRKAKLADTSPEEFMRDRLKDVAFDRVQDALAYMDNQAMMRSEPHKDRIRGILDGTYTTAAPSVGTFGEESDTDTDSTG